MRKTAAACVLLLALLALLAAFPAFSAGPIVKDKQTPYAGTVAPAGTISFQVAVRITKRKNGKTRTSQPYVINAAFSVPVTCPGGTTTVARKLNIRAKLFRTWHMTGVPVSNESVLLADIDGSRTSGTIRVHGDLDGTPQGHGCDSGLLSWTAARG